MQLRSFYFRSTFGGAYVRKNTRLSPHVQVQFLVPEWRSLGTRLIQNFNVETELGTKLARDELCVGGARTLVLAATSELGEITPVFKTVR